MSGLLMDSFTQQKDGARSYKVTGLVSHHGEELEFKQVAEWSAIRSSELAVDLVS